MALERITTRTETRGYAVFPKGYFRIVSVNANKRNAATIDIQVLGFADKEASAYAKGSGDNNRGPMPGGMNGVQEYEKTFNVSSTAFDGLEIPADTKKSDAPFALAYQWLKTQPDFANSENC